MSVWKALRSVWLAELPQTLAVEDWTWLLLALEAARLVESGHSERREWAWSHFDRRLSMGLLRVWSEVSWVYY